MEPRKEAFVAEKSLAVVGISATQGFGNTIYKTLKDKGYRVFGVGAKAQQVEGDPCFKSLSDLPEKVGGVVTVVKPDQTAAVVEDCARLGVRRVWMQQGSESPQAIEAAEKHGLEPVHHACILMYAQPRGVHKFHRWVHDLFDKRG